MLVAWRHLVLMLVLLADLILVDLPGTLGEWMGILLVVIYIYIYIYMPLVVESLLGHRDFLALVLVFCLLCGNCMTLWRVVRVCALWALV